jgi:hypothetical protein
MLAAQDVAERLKQIGVMAVHVKLRATGGNKTKTPGPGAQSALRALARAGIKIGRIGERSGRVLRPKPRLKPARNRFSFPHPLPPRRGRDAHAERQDTQKGRSPRSPSVDPLPLVLFLAGRGKNTDIQPKIEDSV